MEGTLSQLGLQARPVAAPERVAIDAGWTATLTRRVRQSAGQRHRQSLPRSTAARPRRRSMRSNAPRPRRFPAGKTTMTQFDGAHVGRTVPAACRHVAWPPASTSAVKRYKFNRDVAPPSRSCCLPAPSTTNALEACTRDIKAVYRGVHGPGHERPGTALAGPPGRLQRASAAPPIRKYRLPLPADQLAAAARFVQQGLPRAELHPAVHRRDRPPGTGRAAWSTRSVAPPIRAMRATARRTVSTS